MNTFEILKLTDNERERVRALAAAAAAQLQSWFIDLASSITLSSTSIYHIGEGAAYRRHFHPRVKSYFSLHQNSRTVSLDGSKQREEVHDG